MPRMTAALPPAIAREHETIREIALALGLDFFEVLFEMVDFQQMNEIAAYMGFPTRYPHWRWGMEYERMRKSYSYGLHRIYEMVINNDPCYAYLLDSNELVDQKIVIAHVLGHSDFFKNNLWFSQTNRKMMDEMANHATRVWRIIERIGMEEVEEFIDVCLSLENLIDRHAPYRDEAPPAPADPNEREVELRRPTAPKLRVERPYMDRFINPPSALHAEASRRHEALRERVERFPEDPQRDVLHFLLAHAPLERWQQDILDIVRQEAYYFAPQGMTKILNEGWACLVAGSLLFTDQGLRPIEEVVQAREALRVSDGDEPRALYDWATFAERETVYLRTRRGLEVEGSTNHRLRVPGGDWRRLDEFAPGDRLCVAGGNGLWPEAPFPLRVAAPPRVIPWGAPALADPALTVMDEALAAFLGQQVADGSLDAEGVQLDTGDAALAGRYAASVQRLFGVGASPERRGGRWWCRVADPALAAWLAVLGLPMGQATTLPEAIRRSPRAVVVAFLRAFFDHEGQIGPDGIRLSTARAELARVIQLLLLNMGILSTRHTVGEQGALIITGASAQGFAEGIGFGLARKQAALQRYAARQGEAAERWEDEVVAIERRRAPVYDLSVAVSHCYAAQGVINHNSYWHSTIMTRSGVMTDAEVVDYADHHSGTVAMSPQRINPYKIGLELLRDIEVRWNKGRFGKAWEECDDARARREWDQGLGLGRDKLFEVRRIYNDIGFIDTFFTEDFCNRHQLFTYHYNERTGRYEITSREFEAVKQKLLFSLTNFGQPVIEVVDGNHENRGALLLVHRYEGIELKLDEARDTLKNLFVLWKRPVFLRTVIDETPRLLSFDGREHATKRVK